MVQIRGDVKRGRAVREQHIMHVTKREPIETMDKTHYLQYTDPVRHKRRFRKQFSWQNFKPRHLDCVAAKYMQKRMAVSGSQRREVLGV